MGAAYVGVAVVGRHRFACEGVVQAVHSDPLLKVVLRAASVTEVADADAAYDVGVVTEPGPGTGPELRELYARVPTVVVVGGDGWHEHVAPWRDGAAVVVSGRVEDPVLAGAVRHARDDDAGGLTPSLARALQAAAVHHELPVPPALGHAIALIAAGRPARSAAAAADVPETAWRRGLEDLRRRLPRDDGPEDRRPPDDLVPGVLPPEAAVLTSREREVLGEYADGHTYEEIATCLHVSVTTVRNHVTNALGKAGVARTDGETRWCFAVYVSGRHARPESLRRRLGLTGRIVQPRAAGL